MASFGEFARDRLKDVGKSQKALAGSLGVSPAYISQIFTGKKNPPDLSKPRNRRHLRIWSQFLEVPEEDILELIRHQLHRIPLKPAPKYRNMRRLLLKCLSGRQEALAQEIKGLRAHPAELTAIRGMAQIFMILNEDFDEERGYGTVRFRELCCRVSGNTRFIETELVGFFEKVSFSWSWDPQANDVSLSSESEDIRLAIERLNDLFTDAGPLSFQQTVPVVGHVSAGEGFEYTDGGYMTGEGFEQVELPPGVDPSLADSLYCVRIRGNSLKEFINEGALLFIKPHSWEEIRDGDLVIFKAKDENLAYVKKVEFAGDNLILKSMNPAYKNMVLQKSHLSLLERVMSVVF
jgi:SOS-response transcriptional repressor LexA